jgi:aryl-alcohol dehydrogenase-like predicted oxidoreductase
MPRVFDLGHQCPPVLRLGLASRGNTHLSADDVTHAVTRGVNYLNWCGHDNGMAQAVREKRFNREQVVIAAQLQARTRSSADRELAKLRRTMGTDRIDVVTFYYVEEEPEWREISGTGGALESLLDAQSSGAVRIIGLTTHQRALGAKWAESCKLDLLMIRYNAAHRGAEQDVFPTTDRLGIPVVAYTAERWGALTKRTADDPAGFVPPPAPEWYRFALACPSVSVVLMAPGNGSELVEDLNLLEDWRAPRPDELETLRAHGQRVRQRAGLFP